VNATKPARRSSSGVIANIVLLVIAALWLVGSFQALRVLVAGSLRTQPESVANLIMSLSGTIAGAVFGGAAAGYLARSAKVRPFTAMSRHVCALSGGVVVGLVTAGLSFYTFGATPAVATIVAGVAGCAAVIGSLFAAAKNRDIVFAGLVGTLLVFVVMFLRGWFGGLVNSLYHSNPDAYRWIAIAAGLVIGLCVGLCGYLVLRRLQPKTSLYGFLAAGAAPGALWMFSEIATRIAAALLVANTAEPDVLSGLMMDQSLQAQLDGSMAALFAGATTTVLAFGLLAPKADAKAKAAKRGTAVPAQKSKAKKTAPDAKRGGGKKSTA
jgi:hypothetical protein